MSNGGTPRGDKHPEQSPNELATSDDGSESHLVPGDDTYHDDKQLVADLTALNGQISRYVLRHLDAEAKRAVPTSPDEEQGLATRIMQVGEALEARAKRRSATVKSTIINGVTTEPKLLGPESSHTGDMDNGP